MFPTQSFVWPERHGLIHPDLLILASLTGLGCHRHVTNQTEAEICCSKSFHHIFIEFNN